MCTKNLQLDHHKNSGSLSIFPEGYQCANRSTFWFFRWRRSIVNRSPGQSSSEWWDLFRTIHCLELALTMQDLHAFVAYDVIIKFATAEEAVPLNLTFSNMSSIIGSGVFGSCFTDGPIPFSTRGPLEIHIPYLLRQCVAQFEFQTEVCDSLFSESL